MGWVYISTNKLRQLSDSDYHNNAKEFYNQMSSYGWTINAICGCLGNIDHESQINPGQTQKGFPIGSRNGGFGLPQWDPASKYTDFAKSKGRSVYSGYWQCYTINYQDYGVEWIPTSKFGESYSEFKASTKSVDYLCECFLKNYERASSEQLSARISYANYWYEYFTGVPPEPPTPPSPTDKRKMPIWFYLRKEW